jgi:hypothetical protein
VAISSYSRGHLIVYMNGQWVYQDDRSPADRERPCVKCGLLPTPEGFDACIGYVPGAISACCGHGVEKGYVIHERR